MNRLIKTSFSLILGLMLVFSVSISSFSSTCTIASNSNQNNKDKEKDKNHYNDNWYVNNKIKVKNGLKGEYYNGTSFENLKISRIDKRISFVWNEASPDSKINHNTFSIRWTGQIQPKYSENYTFHAIADDGVRLYVNNQLIINEWNDHGATEFKGNIYLEANKKYDLKMEYYENKGDACAMLLWSSPSQVKEIVPYDRLFSVIGDIPVTPPTPPTPPTPAAPVVANLAGYYNEDVISYDSKRSDGSIDGLGSSYSANLLNMNPIYDKTPFIYGSAQDGKYNSLSCLGQTILLTQGKYDSIIIAGAASNGNTSGTLRINYTDGTQVNYTINMKDWCTSEISGEKIVQTLPHRHTSTGDDTVNNYVFAYQLNIDKSRILSSITLPDKKDMHMLAITLMPTSPVVSSTGNGLAGEYYDNANFTTLKLGRTDQTINFDWGQGAPTNIMEFDSFSVKWAGQIEPKYTETYTFYTLADDGTKLWVNDTLLINDWNEHSVTEKSGTITLTAGTKYNIRLEYYDNQGYASVKLLWSSASQTKEIIPVTQLYH